MSKILRKLKQNASSGTDYIYHFAIVVLITVWIVGCLLLICKGGEVDSKAARKRNKEKVDDDLSPLEKPNFRDEEFGDDDTCITSKQGSQGHFRRPPGAF